MTTAADGMKSGEAITYRVYDASSGASRTADVAYAQSSEPMMRDDDLYISNHIYEVSSLQVKPEPESSPGEVVHAINVGGSSFTASDGKHYERDGVSEGLTYRAVGEIYGTTDDELYLTERYGDFSYHFPVDDGLYEITFKFAEIYWSNVGKRLFDVLLEGQEVVSDLDLYALVGKNTPHEEVHIASVADGWLDILFRTDVDNAKASAILVRTAGSSMGTSSESAPRELDERHLTDGDTPDEYTLERNYPNPFNPITTVRIGIPEESHVLLEVYNVVGRRVAVLLDETRQPGRHEVQFDAERLPSGVYLYRLRAGSFQQVGKMTLIR